MFKKRLTGSECVVRGQMTHRSFKTKLHDHSMRSHRKTLPPVAECCLSAAGGGGARGGRHMRGLRESTHTHAYASHSYGALAPTHLLYPSRFLTSSSSLSWSAQERVWEPRGGKKKVNFFSIWIWNMLFSISSVLSNPRQRSFVCLCVCVSAVVCSTYYLVSLCRWWQTQFSRQISEEAEHWKPLGWRRKTPLWRSTWKIY